MPLSLSQGGAGGHSGTSEAMVTEGCGLKHQMISPSQFEEVRAE